MLQKKNRNRCFKNCFWKSSKTAEDTGDLIGNKTADKITSIGENKSKKKEDETDTFTYHWTKDRK